MNYENSEMEMLLPIVAELAQKYTAFENTSMTYEKAQSLMDAVLYCLEEYRHFPENALADKNIPLKKQYDIGYELVKKKVEAIRNIFNELSLHFEDFGVKNLHDTVRKAIPAFLKWYDAKFCPQDLIITLDYPLLTDYHSLRGADLLYEYLCSMQTEQRFFHKFDKNYILLLLKTYDPAYSDLMENLCDIVLTNIIGHFATEKPFDGTGFNEYEYSQITALFSGNSTSAIERLIKRFLNILVRQYYKNDPVMLSYLASDVKNIAVRIDTAIRFHQLEQLFLL